MMNFLRRLRPYDILTLALYCTAWQIVGQGMMDWTWYQTTAITFLVAMIWPTTLVTPLDD